MSAKTMYDLKETLCTDLEQYAKKGSLTRTDLDLVHMITDTIKNLDKISAMEEQGNSYGMGDWNAYGSYGNSMNSGYSGRRGGYSNDGYGNSGRRSGTNYSNDAGDMEYRMRREMYN